MSRVLEYDEEEDKYIEEIESKRYCKWRINCICSNPDSENLGSWGCDAENKKDEICYKKEDGI